MKVLIVDDNDRYANNLKAFFDARKIETGFDAPGVMFVSKYLLPAFGGVGWMVPKVPLKRGEVVFIPTNLKKGVEFEVMLNA